MNALACRLSALASDTLASPYALPVYILARIAMWRLLPMDVVTLVLSDFANLALLLMAVETARQAKRVERGVVELARVNPAVDDAALG